MKGGLLLLDQLLESGRSPEELLGEVRQAVCDALGIPATYTRSDEIIEHYAQLLRGGAQ